MTAPTIEQITATNMPAASFSDWISPPPAATNVPRTAPISRPQNAPTMTNAPTPEDAEGPWGEGRYFGVKSPMHAV